jgi:hypothetical protein
LIVKRNRHRGLGFLGFGPVSGALDLESSGAEGPAWRPRQKCIADEHPRHHHPVVSAFVQVRRNPEAGHYKLQRQLTFIFTGRSGIVGCHCPVRATVYLTLIDDGNPGCSFAILERLQFVKHETLDLDTAFREILVISDLKAPRIIKFS